MPQFKYFSGNIPEFVTCLKYGPWSAFDFGLLFIANSPDNDTYLDMIEKDFPRESHFNPYGSELDIKEKYKIGSRDYTQGNMTGMGAIKPIFQMMFMFLDTNNAFQTSYIQDNEFDAISISYLDEDHNPSGITISKTVRNPQNPLGNDLLPGICISILRGTTKEPQDRRLYVFTELSLLPDDYNYETTNADIDGNQLLREIKNQLGSEHLYAFIKSLFLPDGRINEVYFRELYSLNEDAHNKNLFDMLHNNQILVNLINITQKLFPNSPSMQKAVTKASTIDRAKPGVSGLSKLSSLRNTFNNHLKEIKEELRQHYSIQMNMAYFPIRLAAIYEVYAANYQPTQLKYQFFSELRRDMLTNKLNSQSLADKLQGLTKDQRAELFKVTALEMLPGNKTAMNLIDETFACLGVRLSDAQKKQWASGLLNEDELAKIKSSCYTSWKDAPSDSECIALLERELKSTANLTDVLEFQNSLAQTLASIQKSDAFVPALRTIITAAPAYLPKLLSDLGEILDDKSIAELFDLFKEQKLDLADSIRQSSFKMNLLWIQKNPQDFSSIVPSMQHELLQALQFQSPEAYRHILDTVERFKNENDITDPLLFADSPQLRNRATNVSDPLIDLIIGQLPQNKCDELIAEDQKIRAKLIIDNYLKTDPNTSKQKFFKELSTNIDNNGFNLDQLKKALDRANRKELFAKGHMFSSRPSNAATTVAHLFKVASLGTELTAIEFNDMINKGILPHRQTAKTSFLKQLTARVLSAPDHPVTSPLVEAIKTGLADISQQMQPLIHQEHAIKQQLEANYQTLLIRKGLKHAETSENPAFDVQGHVLVMVRLDEEDYRELLGAKKLNPELNWKENFELKSGKRYTNPTLCNLDVFDHPALNESFKQWLDNDALYNILAHSADRSSILDLQEEMLMHVTLGLRAIAKQLGLDDGQVETYRNMMIVEVHQLVTDKIHGVLKATSLDIAEINRQLDPARVTLAKECREHLVTKLVNDQLIDKNQAASLDEHIFSSTTATGLDYLRTDSRNQTVTRISATDQTSYTNQPGNDHLATRVPYRNRYIHQTGHVLPYEHPTLECRVPSIAEKNVNDETGRTDVADKLSHIHDQLREQAMQRNTPMVYNLLTSLHSFAYDNSPVERGKKQRRSAQLILQGAHRYNAERLAKGDSQAFTYVQNIPVNQHTRSLVQTLAKDIVSDEVLLEARLMTDLAMLSTLNSNAHLFPVTLREEITRAYQQAHHDYKQFLPVAGATGFYFHKSEQGVKLGQKMAEWKKQWACLPLPNQTHSLHSLVSQTLFAIYASNQHYDKQFGMLVQSLSLFIEPISLAGCTNANERYQSVAGRVDVLKSISERDKEQLSVQEKELIDSLLAFIDGKGSCEGLQKALDTAYNQHFLYGTSTVFTKEDQGAASRIQATANKNNPGVVSEIKTNIAESGYLTRLSQTSTSGMQSHSSDYAAEYRQLVQNQLNPLGRPQ